MQRGLMVDSDQAHLNQLVGECVRVLCATTSTLRISPTTG